MSHPRPDLTFVLGRTVIEHWPGHCRVTLPDGAHVFASPQDNAEYRARAFELGYGGDTTRMAVEHDTAHVLLAHLLGLPESPSLRSAAVRSAPSHATDMEEGLVLAFQAFCNTMGIDLLAVVRRYEARR